MKADVNPRPNGLAPYSTYPLRAYSGQSHGLQTRFTTSFSRVLDGWLGGVAACPWGAHAGYSPLGAQNTMWSSPTVTSPPDLPPKSKQARVQLYTSTERARRDASPWTMVQAVLAPLQFAACAVSLLLIVRYLLTGHGYALATGSILLKTAALYAIMITGSIWEKDVFGKWLFAPAFFWEDMVSMVVLALQTAYVVALLRGWGSPAEQMAIAIAAYTAYAVNASQFLMKLRAARLDVSSRHAVAA